MPRCFIYTVLVLVCVMLTHCSAQMTSCTGRCGESYYRGYLCHCDYECLTHEECCQDYEAKCTTSGSCKGRCGESFKRGRQCDCDADCKEYNKCCPDFKQFCNPEEATIKPANSAAVGPNLCMNAHASKPADPPMPQDSVQTESENENEGIPDSVLSPTSPLHEEQPVPLAPENEINGESDTPEESAISEDTSGHEPPATSAPESLVPTIAAVTPMTSVAEDVQAALDAELREEGLSLDDAKPSPADEAPPTVPDPTSLPSPSPASQIPTTQNPDMTEPPLKLPASVTTLASTPASEGEDQTNTTQSTPSEPTSNPASDDKDPAKTTASVASEPTTAPPKMTTTTAESPASTQASVTPSEEGDPPAPDAEKTPEESAISTEAPAVSNAVATTASPKVQDASENTATPSAKPTEDSNTATPSAKPTEAQDATATKPPPAASTAVPTDQAQDSKPQSLATQRPSATSLPPVGTTKPVEMTTKPLASTAKPVEKTTKAPKATVSPSKPTKKPEKPTSVNAIDFPGLDSRDYQSDDSNDTNLCSGRPINGLTTLRNGTTAVFRGHYFWLLDARRVPGPAQGITDVWGIPSPIDTVFTRCNCQGKTYFLKGQNYWRFENDVRDPGYPKAIRTGFDGLSGHITAALSVPAYMKRRESVYFFKRGGKVQKYSYDPKKTPKCGSQPNQRVHYAVYTRRTRQAETYLGREISIMANWKGFPTKVTSAVSIPIRQAVDGYNYYVFSRTRHYRVRMDADRPTLTTPIHTTQTQSPKSFFNCPENTSA